jgi:fructose-bisphosphate aldolase class II
MPLVPTRDILVDARKNGYGVLSLLGGNLDMVLGMIAAAEQKRSPLILVYNEDVTPQIPMELAMPMLVRAAQNASVPVSAMLDHGRDLEHAARAIHLGASGVMYDGSSLPYEENVARTQEIVRVAHAMGVSVEAELGSISGSAVQLGDRGPEATFTDPHRAADFVRRTRVDALAISFGNTHGLYRGEPRLDLDRVQEIYALVDVPLAMHGASGLDGGQYKGIVESGISKICYYTAMGIGASQAIRELLETAGPGTVVYHNIIARAIDYFYRETMRLIDLVGPGTRSDLSS